MRSVVITLILISIAIYAQYVTDHFIIHADDKVLAGYLEEAYSYYTKKGLRPMPPCVGNRYPVYINDTLPFTVFTKFDPLRRCVEKIEFNPNFIYNKATVFYGVATTFFPYRDYFWAVNAAIWAMASIGADFYHYSYQYFSERLYKENPFNYVVWSEEWYYYSAAFIWYLQKWDDWRPILRVADWREAARLYTQFLLEAIRGMQLGGGYIMPAMEELTVNTNINLRLDGYSAAYFKVRLPGVGAVRVDAPGLISNIRLGESFYVDNGTLLIALVNDRMDPIDTTVSIHYIPIFTTIPYINDVVDYDTQPRKTFISDIVYIALILMVAIIYLIIIKKRSSKTP